MIRAPSWLPSTAWLRKRGTSVGQGILASLNAIAAGSSGGPPAEIYSNLLLTPTPTPTPVPHGTYTPAVIILLSDGENNENPDPLAAAQTAADRGVRIYTVGIGSPTGTTVHINGFSLHTQLDEATLQQISQITGGTYYNAQSAQDLLKIYDSPRHAIDEQTGKDRAHRTFCRGEHLLHVDRRPVFTPVVQPPSVTTQWNCVWIGDNRWNSSGLDFFSCWY